MSLDWMIQEFWPCKAGPSAFFNGRKCLDRYNFSSSNIRSRFSHVYEVLWPLLSNISRLDISQGLTTLHVNQLNLLYILYTFFIIQFDFFYVISFQFKVIYQ
ncbi:hypothetical protein ABFX02_11G077700 [Erythranthe guttata]